MATICKSAPLGSLALLALCACTAQSPDRTAPDSLRFAVPSEWSGAKATGAVADAWWADFGDATLSTLIAEALAFNHDSHASAARIEAAAIRARLAGADLEPRLEGRLNGTRQRQNFVGLPIPGSSGVLSRTFESYGLSLAASWEIDLWGRVRAGASAAIADHEAVRDDAIAFQHSLAAQVAKAWFAVLDARSQVELAEQTVASYTTTSDWVRRRYESGARPALDLRLAENTLASARSLEQARREQLARATRRLELLLGRYPKGAIAQGALPKMPASLPGGQPLELLRRRPDIRAAERRLAAKSRRIDEARAALFPRISLTGSGGTSTAEFEDLLDTDFRVWNLAANLVQPILDGGRLRGNIALRRAEAREAAELYAQTTLRAFQEVESELASDKLVRQRVAHALEAERTAKAALALADRRYTSGLTEFQAVLESQRRALDASSQVLDLRRRQLDQRVDLYLALGGGYRRFVEPAAREEPVKKP